MLPEQKKLVQSSFALIEPKAKEAGMALYARLFTLDPSLRTLFRGEIKEQAIHIMAVVGATADSLDNMEEMLPYLYALGRRHVEYGVLPKHYALGGEALLYVLEQSLGDVFTPAMKSAWAEAYAAITTPMQEGAYSVAGEPNPP